MIEMLVIIGIIAVLSAISFPFIIDSLSNLRLSNFGKQMVLDLRYAQQLTVSEQNIHYVEFSQGEGNYQIIKTDTSEIVKNKDLPSGINYQNISFTDDKVIFNNYGAVSETGSTTLINTRTNKTATIEVKPSGHINFSL